MEIQLIEFSKTNEPRQKTIFNFMVDGTNIQYGTVLLKKGIRIPEKGFTKHPQFEISYLKSGKIQTINTDGSPGDMLNAGDVVKFEADEPQAGFVIEETQIIYILIG